MPICPYAHMPTSPICPYAHMQGKLIACYNGCPCLTWRCCRASFHDTPDPSAAPNNTGSFLRGAFTYRESHTHPGLCDLILIQDNKIQSITFYQFVIVINCFIVHDCVHFNGFTTILALFSHSPTCRPSQHPHPHPRPCQQQPLSPVCSPLPPPAPRLAPPLP